MNRSADVSAPAQQLYQQDPSVTLLGIELIEATPTGATVRMTVRPEMCNGFGIGHGGITFLLADSAMAFASNAAGGTALATSANIDWVAPVNVGDTLTATARLHHGPGASKIWAIAVTDQHGSPVASVTGRTRLVERP